MNDFVKTLLKELLKEIPNAIEALGGKAGLTDLALVAFDRYVQPIDLPGPDAVVDPLIRKYIPSLVSALYDATMARIRVFTA